MLSHPHNRSLVPRPRRPMRWKRTLCAALSVALLSGAAVSTASAAACTCPLCGCSTGLSVSEIAQAALPSVVSITNVSVQKVQWYVDRFGRFGYNSGLLEETTSAGSGIIIERTDDALYILTNYHVVEDANTLSVGFADDTVCQASLCGTDEALDLAVVKVVLSGLPDDTLSASTVATVGDSDALQVGEQVVAIGNALGYGQSVTTGIVSALNRSLSTDTSTTPATYIQTDAAINPGNSGGALLNMRGEVVGINTAKLSSTDVEGMGYAIPISDVWDTVQQLKTQSTALTQVSLSSSQFWR